MMVLMRRLTGLGMPCRNRWPRHLAQSRDINLRCLLFESPFSLSMFCRYDAITSIAVCSTLFYLSLVSGTSYIWSCFAVILTLSIHTRRLVKL